ncbi:Protein ANTAGONIST OF LIKE HETEROCHROMATIN PROTEIN 1 [Frankliniella fusca]|uniref:Protein ANTAGONIST OF LIKE HETEROCHROMATIN PROTEIN 1 n=1 Tax=Frankliniella fusca TaxID=407009 RepID=A0AAE1LAI1_9NEOP|nr:Protein ANTAGONIST OF LIKE HETEROCHROMATIN PROTEIN 1 [Frankliniella fusca]
MLFVPVAVVVISFILEGKSQRLHSVAGPFRIIPDHAEYCPKRLFGKKGDLTEWHFSFLRDRHDINTFRALGNFTTLYWFGDHLNIELAFSSWSSRGGWKENALILRMSRLCKSAKTYMARQWKNAQLAIHPNNASADCPYPPAQMDRLDPIILYWWWRRRRRRRRAAPVHWIRPFIQQRTAQGAFDNLVAEMRDDIEKFIDFHRMTPQQFDILLAKIRPDIEKMNVTRESVSPALRLSLTLRYLASGDSMVSLHYLYRVGKATITHIIPETCEALWNALKQDVLSLPTVEECKKIGDDFGERWDFPNCLGAIDGKHVVVQCFSRTGSQFYNYKNTFSIVLLGVCDSQYRFTWVSIGAAGRESNGRVFENTEFGSAVLAGTLPLPEPKILPNSNFLAPYVFVGNAAFPLKENLLRPYPGTHLHASKTIFNYRLSRARRTIENTFGVLASKFRIYRKPIVACISTAEKIVKATVVLHNWLREVDLDVAPEQRRYIPLGLVDVEDRHGNVEFGAWREEPPAAGFRGLEATVARNPTVRAKEVQDMFREYFITSGRGIYQVRNATVDLGVTKQFPAFFYGRWRVDGKLVEPENKTGCITCMRVYVDVVPQVFSDKGKSGAMGGAESIKGYQNNSDTNVDFIPIEMAKE